MRTDGAEEENDRDADQTCGCSTQPSVLPSQQMAETEIDVGDSNIISRVLPFDGETIR